jgi:hypothetical protein
MPVLQCAISQKAMDWLREKVPGGRGFGVLVTEIVTEARAREEFQKTLEAHKPALRDSWDAEANLDAVE